MNHRSRSASALRLCLSLLVLALTGISTRARADDLPSVDLIMAKYVQAIGGADAWKSVKSYRSAGTFAMPAMGMEASIVMMGNGDDLRVSVDIPGAGAQLQGVNGDVVWEYSTMAGPRIMEGKEAAASRRQADLLWFLDWKRQYASGTCTAIEPAGGVPCYRIEFVTPEGTAETHFYEVESGLGRQVAMTVTHQMGEIPMTMTIENYGDYEGLKFPATMKQTAVGMEQIITLTTFEKNPEFEKDAFALPAEVQALLQPAGK